MIIFGVFFSGKYQFLPFSSHRNRGKNQVQTIQLIFKVRNPPTTIPAAQPVKEMNTEAVSVHRKNKEEVNLSPSKLFKVDKNREA